MESRRPRVVIIAGINGAGKTTTSQSLLPRWGIDTYLDADAMAREMAEDDPQHVAIRAGRMMRAEIDRLRDSTADFALETTMSGQSLQRTLADLHSAGYQSNLLYLWLPNAHMAVRRVKGRVKLGGHHIPTEDVLRRYLRSVRNFEQVYRHEATAWRVYHAGRGQWGSGGVMIARGGMPGAIQVYDAHAWREIQQQAASETGGGPV
jgi:predicted ABC-type ATPase